MEKREVWQTIEDNPPTREPRIVPAINLIFWRIREGVQPGVGTTMGYLYTLYDNTFEIDWEIVS
jgi:hypothetical protein